MPPTETSTATETATLVPTPVLELPTGEVLPDEDEVLLEATEDIASATPSETPTLTASPSLTASATPTPTPTPTAFFYLGPVIRQTGAINVDNWWYRFPVTYTRVGNDSIAGLIAVDRSTGFSWEWKINDSPPGLVNVWANSSANVPPVGGLVLTEAHPVVQTAYPAGVNLVQQVPGVIQEGQTAGEYFEFRPTPAGGSAGAASAWVDYRWVFLGWPTPTPVPTMEPTPEPTPTPTNTPTPTPAMCIGSLVDPTSPPDTGILLRERPGIGQTIMDQLEGGTPVNLIDGVNYADGHWWWHISLVTNPDTEGYVREDLVNDYNSCPRVVVEPPPLPPPQAGEICYVNLKEGYSAEIRDGSGAQGELIGTITDPSQTTRVYGTNYGDRGLFLISQPGVLPQQWVERARFDANPPGARVCKDTVLGRFNRTTDQAYWTAVGAYANNFRAPISSAQYTNEYPIFRNSYHYVPGAHGGTDLVYRPPDGGGNSIPFDVYAQSNGVVVDAGPDGITHSYQYEKNYCGQATVPGNQYPNHDGVFYWNVPIGAETCGTDGSGQPITGVREIYFVAVMGNKDDAILDEQRDAETPATGYYDFGLSLQEQGDLLRVLQFTNVCSSNPGVCVDQPGRRLLIWYDVANDEPNDEPNRPEIQTVYYHVAVDLIPQYGSWRSVCSSDRNVTWTKTATEDDPNYDICEIATDGFWIGQARQIGFATAPHLHYEVYIDRDNDGIVDHSDSRDREDPLMAFWTIR